MVLLAKLTAGAVGFTAALGLVWTLLFAYASRPGTLPAPPRTSILAEGWAFVALGFLLYLAAGLSAVSTARWYTTRLFPLGFAAGVVFLALVVPGAAAAWCVMAVGVVVLAPQLVGLFASREF